MVPVKMMGGGVIERQKKKVAEGMLALSCHLSPQM